MIRMMGVNSLDFVQAQVCTHFNWQVAQCIHEVR